MTSHLGTQRMGCSTKIGLTSDTISCGETKPWVNRTRVKEGVKCLTPVQPQSRSVMWESQEFGD